jgi:hypothetical protein
MSFQNKVTKYGPRLKKDLGLTDVQVAGVFGNLGAETGGFTLLQEKNPVVAGSRGGYGWMQWTGPRRKKYEAWAAAKGLNVADDETNYAYLVHETKTEEGKSLQYLKLTKTVDEAVESFCTRNLRPGIPHMESRKRWGAKAYKALTSTAPSAGQVATDSAPPIIVGGTIASQTPPNYWPWIIGGVVLAIAVTAFIRWRIKKRKINVVDNVNPGPNNPPRDGAGNNVD